MTSTTYILVLGQKQQIANLSGYRRIVAASGALDQFTTQRTLGGV
jgi:hypothetical protein